VLRLLASTIGEPDDGEARQPAVDVRLDLDPPRLETDKGVGDCTREHGPTLDAKSARVRDACVPTSSRLHRVSEWTELDERTLFAGWRTIVGRRFRTPDGLEREFEIKLEGDTAVVFALTSEREVVLVREYRPGPRQSLLELPGGAVDHGEEPPAAARRELLEETGYSGELQAVGTILDCAYSTRRRHTFVATDCEQVQEPTPHDGEFPEVVLMALPEFREHLRSGLLTDVASGYAALDALTLL
jgi:ADP-ribose pyrophosphatase